MDFSGWTNECIVGYELDVNLTEGESPRDSVSLSLDMFNILNQFEGGSFFLKKRVGTFYNVIH